MLNRKPPHTTSIADDTERIGILAATERIARQGSWKSDVATGKVLWSDGMYRLLGMDRDTLPADLAPSFYAAIHPDDLHLLIDEETLEPLLQPNGTRFRLIRKDGSVRRVYMESQEQDSELRRLRVGLVRDVTDEEFNEERLVRAAILGDHSRDALLSVSAEGVVLDCNSAAVDMYGYSKSEFIGKHLSELRAPGVAVTLPACGLGHVSATAILETEHMRKDGTVFHVEISAKGASGDRPYSVSAVRDVTDRVRERQAIIRTTRVLSAVGACNDLLLRSTDSAQLRENICQVLVESGPYQLAWCGLVADDEKKTVQPVASAGKDSDYPDTIFVSWDLYNPNGAGPVGTAIRTGRPSVFRDVAHHPCFLWREHADLRGWVSIASIPLMRGAVAFGALTLYSSDPNSFDDGEIELLSALVRNTAYGLSAYDAADSLCASEAGRVELALSAIEALGRTMAASRPVTHAHEVRVSELAARIAQEMGLGDYYVQAIRQAGLVHDLGKMHVPSAILLKPGTLSAQETELVRSHPDRGHDILKDISFPWPVADVVWEHHERMDGSGYPRGLKGENISLLARVVAVADVLDATAAERSYHSAATMQEAFEGLIAKPYGFDPRVVSACARLHERGEL